jgi:hypothetical protein
MPATSARIRGADRAAARQVEQRRVLLVDQALQLAGGYGLTLAILERGGRHDRWPVNPIGDRQVLSQPAAPRLTRPAARPTPRLRGPASQRMQVRAGSRGCRWGAFGARRDALSEASDRGL